MATSGSPGSSSEDMDYDYFDDDNSEDLSYSDLEVFPGGFQKFPLKFEISNDIAADYSGFEMLLTKKEESPPA